MPILLIQKTCSILKKKQKFYQNTKFNLCFSDYFKSYKKAPRITEILNQFHFQKNQKFIQ